MDNLRLKAGRKNSKEAAKDRQVSSNQRVSIAGKKYHFIGAGGVGMSGLAKLLIKNGAIVSGSDEMASNVIAGLNQDGADIKTGHNAENVPKDAEAVVISAAIKKSNVELAAARQKGVKVYKYAQMLGRLMDCYKAIAVCGTHGKSTTSGWLAFVLGEAGVEPSFIVGAEIVQLGTSSAVGNGPYFIAEACEYDRSFLNLHPEIAVILNIEQDHLDYYKNEAEIVEAFCEFAEAVSGDGVIIANGRDNNVANVIKRIGPSKRCVTFGLGSDCDFSAQNIQADKGLYSFDVYHNGRSLGGAKISLPGMYNVLNSLAVIAAAVEADVAVEDVLEILPRFVGMDRRMMLRANVGTVTIVDDYAHHPTEIKAALGAMRQRFEPRRIFCVFQPHQYSRTRFLLDDFAESFKLADITIVPEIYFVRDTQASRRQVNSQMLVERICAGGSDAVFIDSFSGICEYLKENVAQNDLVVTMGAGDIWKIADEYIQWLRENS